MKRKPQIPDAPIVLLKYRVEAEQREGLLDFLRNAVSFYEAPGGITVRLFEDLCKPGHFLELVLYATELDYKLDQNRIENDPTAKKVLDQWHSYIKDLEVIEAKYVPIVDSEKSGYSYSNSEYTIDLAPVNQWAAIKALMESASLPYPKAQEAPVILVCATSHDGDVLGCIGWQSYGQVAVLRSLVIRNDSRKKGIATALVRAALHKLRKRQVQKVFVLTEGSEFAKRFGFESVVEGDIENSRKLGLHLDLGCKALELV